MDPIEANITMLHRRTQPFLFMISYHTTTDFLSVY